MGYTTLVPNPVPNRNGTSYVSHTAAKVRHKILSKP